MATSTPDDVVRALRDAQRPDEVELVDFSYAPEPIRFTADGERYECYPVLSVTAMQRLVQVVRSGGLDLADGDDVDPEKMTRSLEKITGIFSILMPSESARRFNQRVLGESSAESTLAERSTAFVRELAAWSDVHGTEPSIYDVAARARKLLAETDSAPTPVRPLDLQRQVLPILHWVLERYGLRPTEPPSS